MMMLYRQPKHQEVTIEGLPASPGIAAGKIYVLSPRVKEKNNHSQEIEPSDEIDRFENARAELQQQWEQLRESESVQESKDLLGVQIGIINDEELTRRVQALIMEEDLKVEEAIVRAFEGYIDLLSDSSSDKAKSQTIDLVDTRNRLIEVVNDQEEVVEDPAGCIVVAEDLSPREVVELSRKKMKAFVTEKGAYTSHAAIIARSMAIPSIAGAEGIIEQIDSITEDSTMLIDGQTGLITLNPLARTLYRSQSGPSGPVFSSQQRNEIYERPSETSDGHPFTIRVNVGLKDELQNLKEYHAEGVGLVRTESIFQDKKGINSAEKQIELYERVVNQTNDNDSISFRLFDRDEDDGDQEDSNRYGRSFLGWRGIRMLLSEPAILQTQLKALLTVACKNPRRIRILLPMVSSLNEVTALIEEMESCLKELSFHPNGIQTDIPLGMMVEIPGTALQTSSFVDKIDFFSIGTNDLTQYLLAVDRGNALVSDLYDQRHPAVWKIINQVITQAKTANKPVEVCGEIASHPIAAACLTGMGISALSMSPTNIPRVKKLLTERSITEMKILAEDVLHCKELKEIKTLFQQFKSDSPKQ
jgi:phosphotransferase system enzyme I (PtsI)